MIRKVLPATLALLLVAVPAAGAEDPLLSGYAGPGGGDQAVLGSQLIGGSGKGGGGGPSGGAGAAATSRSLQAPAAPAGSGSAAAPAASGSGSGSGSGSPAAKRKGAGKRSGAKGSKGSAHRPGSARPGATTHRPAPAGTIAAYPSAHASGAGALPFSGADVLLALLGAGVVAAVAAGTLRLTRTRPEPGL